MTKGEYLSNTDTTCYPEKTLKGKLTPQEEIDRLNELFIGFIQ